MATGAVLLHPWCEFTASRQVDLGHCKRKENAQVEGIAETGLSLHFQFFIPAQCFAGNAT
jgi:hypothetical protein